MSSKQCQYILMLSVIVTISAIFVWFTSIYQAIQAKNEAKETKKLTTTIEKLIPVLEEYNDNIQNLEVEVIFE